METKQIAKNRINQLINFDKQSDSNLTSQFNQTLLYIQQNMQFFYAKYASENGLTMSQATGKINSWDLTQWRKAINHLDYSNWNENLKKRGAILGKLAGFDKVHMMTSIIGLGALSLINKQYQYINQRVAKDTADQANHMMHTLNLSRLPKISSAPGTVEQWSDNLWIKSDRMVNDLQWLVNKHLNQGISLHDLQDMLANHNQDKQFKPNMSIADRLKQSEFNARRIVRTESARSIDYVNMKAYVMSGVRKVDIINQAGACIKCQALADNSPYSIDDVPMLPFHPNCRCTKVPHTN